GGDGAVPLPGEAPVRLGQAVVVVPRLAAAAPDLDEADAALQQAAGDEQLPAVDAGAVGLAHLRRLAADVEGVGGLGLHAVGQLERLDAGLQLRVVRPLPAVQAVEAQHQVELAALLGEGDGRVVDVLDQPADVG